MNRTSIGLMCGAMICAALTGCASWKLGDGKAGNIPLDPAVEWVANAADKQLPGTGAGTKIRDYWAKTGQETVPPGFHTVWVATDRSGVVVDLATLKLTPHLEPITIGPFKPVTAADVIAANNPDANVPAGTNEIPILDLLTGGASKFGTSKKP